LTKYNVYVYCSCFCCVVVVDDDDDDNDDDDNDDDDDDDDDFDSESDDDDKNVVDIEFVIFVMRCICCAIFLTTFAASVTQDFLLLSLLLLLKLFTLISFLGFGNCQK
jgi:hypothetical protein